MKRKKDNKKKNKKRQKKLKTKNTTFSDWPHFSTYDIDNAQIPHAESQKS